MYRGKNQNQKQGVYCTKHNMHGVCQSVTYTTIYANFISVQSREANVSPTLFGRSVRKSKTWCENVSQSSH